jgi:hypothetical protein
MALVGAHSLDALPLNDDPRAISLVRSLRCPVLREGAGARLLAAREAGVDVLKPCSGVAQRTSAGGAGRRSPLMALLMREESLVCEDAWNRWAGDSRRRRDPEAQRQAAGELEKRALWAKEIACVAPCFSLADWRRAGGTWETLLRLPLASLEPLFAEAAADPALWADSAGESPWNALASRSPPVRRDRLGDEERDALHEALLAAEAPSSLSESPWFAIMRESAWRREDEGGMDVDISLGRALARSGLAFKDGGERSALAWMENTRRLLRGRVDDGPRLDRFERVYHLLEAELLREEVAAASARSRAAAGSGPGEEPPAERRKAQRL